MSVVDEAQLFEIEKPPPVSLADKFGVPPFSVLDRRGGEWQDRKRQWGRLGIQSEIGRDSIVNRLNIGDNGLALMLRSGAKGMGVPLADGISVFDPVVCELAYRWHTLPGDRILDPFAGGSVRGIVASTLARWYVGVDLRGEQVAANEAQAHLGSDIAPRWIQGDSARLADHLDPADERVHQHLLIFVKGDAKRAATRLEDAA